MPRDASPSPLPPARLAGMISGGGRTLLNILDHIDRGSLRATVPIVIASTDCAGVERLRTRGVHVEIHRGVLPADRLAAILRPHAIDYIILAGYLKYINVPAGFERRIINIHPALLPKFGGPGMYGHRVHEAVLAAREQTSGCTVHFVDAEFDHGPIILQRSCPVYESDTPETLAVRVFEQECIAFPEALKQLIS